MDGEHLPGGSGGVWRVRGEDGAIRVHRPTGPWTPAVHALLAHLEAAGLGGIPHVEGIDAEGREVLSYLPGRTPDPSRETVDDEALATAAAWLRSFHTAVADFDPGPVEWRQGVFALGPGEVICHNDTGLYNWVVDERGSFVGMIDWDRAGPGRPLDDLAFLCWSGVPLMREIPTPRAAGRLRVAADAYGDVSPEALLDAVDARMRLTAERWRVGIERGDPGTLAIQAAGIPERHAAQLRGFESRIAGIRHGLREAGAPTSDGASTSTR
ncbi:phosphotransferase [Leucobacter sp. CSA1]|uniref:Phosphotransferase n=1 Tax=Leucobacter chromiisoli TaxID=2796471 RepID=A0A934Q3N7_9MICO|nr:phosphotransferase [Leucobacter chromiisoli]MBK0417870.1 phosphotransferase [Leucobacter chromiisoli]